MTRFLVLLSVMFWVVGCGGPATTTLDAGTPQVALAVAETLSARAPTDTATPSPTPTLTPTSTWTPTPTPTSTRAPTPAPSRSPTPTPGTAGADVVIAFNPGAGAQGKYGDPRALLGAPDLEEDPCCQGMLQLGRGGSVLVAFADNAVTDGDGADLQVVGESAKDDLLLVEVSADGQVWRAFPQGSESPGGLDLAHLGLDWAVYVRLTDVQPGTPTGAEVDAVVALHSGPRVAGGLPALPDAVARSELVLRNGPHSRMKETGRVAAGTALTVLGRSPVAGWAKVQAADGSSGWCVLADLGLNVALSGFEVAQAQATPTPTPTRSLCPPSPALVEVINWWKAPLTLQMDGPQKYTVSVPAGERRYYCVVPGDYALSLTAEGCEAWSQSRSFVSGPVCNCLYYPNEFERTVVTSFGHNLTKHDFLFACPESYGPFGFSPWLCRDPEAGYRVCSWLYYIDGTCECAAAPSQYGPAPLK
jgi:hypothetical protein